LLFGPELFKTNLNLSFNNFSGPLPSWNCKLIERLNLNNNNLTGEIPHDFLGPTIILDLSHNELSGEIPLNIFDRIVQKVSLEHNQLEGNIPKINRDRLSNIDLSYNNLSGQIPSELRHLSSFFMRNINLEHNQLTGVIPFTLTNNAIDSIDVSNNNLIGIIPKFNAFGIKMADFSNNNLQGCFDEDFFEECDRIGSDFLERVFTFNNPQLPFEGNLQELCDQAFQIGAPCEADGDLTTDEFITSDCVCDMSVSNNDLLQDLKINVYPNPVDDLLSIFIEDENFEKQFRLEILKSTGEKVFSEKQDGMINKIEIPTSSFTSGLYYLNIITTIRTETRKIVISRT